MAKLAGWLGLAAVCAFAGLAGAAQPPSKPAGKPAEPAKHAVPMQVIIATDGRPGCEPDCARWIAADGEIGPGTAGLFQRVFKTLGKTKLPVFISSNGGSVEAAIAVGRQIRKLGLDVAVERTVFPKCETGGFGCDPGPLKDGDKGRPEAARAFCASSCVFILAAGVERVVPSYGFVGVHQIIEFQRFNRVRRLFQVQRRLENGRPVEVSRKLISEKTVSSSIVEKDATDANYRPIRAYFAEMGIDTAAIMPLLLATPHTSIHWMTLQERKDTKVTTLVGVGTDMLPLPAPASVRAAGTQGAPLTGAITVRESLLDKTGKPGEPADFSLKPVASTPLLVEIDITPVHQTATGPVAKQLGKIQLTNGHELSVFNRTGGNSDPLMTTIGMREFCGLGRSGRFYVNVAVRGDQDAAFPPMAVIDMAKANGFAAFVANQCTATARAQLVMLSADGKPVSPSEVRLKHQAGSKDIEIVVAPGQSGPAERTDLMLADIQLTNGRTLFARNRTGGAIDPLSAPLARAEFCRLWQHGSFYLNIGLRDQAHTGAPPLNLLDMAKADGMAVFAAEVCNGG